MSKPLGKACETQAKTRQAPKTRLIRVVIRIPGAGVEGEREERKSQGGQDQSGKGGL